MAAAPEENFEPAEAAEVCYTYILVESVVPLKFFSSRMMKLKSHKPLVVSVYLARNLDV